MKHPSELQFSMYSDGELGTEVDDFEAHVRACTYCQRRAELFSLEHALLSRSIPAGEHVPVPAFPQPVSLGSLTLAALGLAFAAWLTVTIWDSLSPMMDATISRWFLSLHPTDSITPAIETVRFVAGGGMNMVTTLLAYILVGVGLCLFAALLLPRKPSKAVLQIFVFMLASGGLFSQAQALEIRRDAQSILITETEVINDTVIVMSETSIINGTINGDLIALGGRVIVNGTVSGNVLTFGHTVTITGQVGGSVLGSARNMALENLAVANDLWTFAGNVNMDRDTQVQGNATLFANISSIAGGVGRDLTGFSRYLEVSGTIAEDVEAWGQQLTLLGNARINGDLRFRTDRENRLQQSPGTVVGGEVEVLIDEKVQQLERNRFLSLDFYFGQLLRFVSAFVAGLLLFYLTPGLRTVNLSRGVAGLKTAGIGLLVLVSTPIILILISLTIIAIPLAILGLFSWIAVIYLAKILIALLIGNLLLIGRDARWPLAMPLLVGLVVVFIVINLPLIGGVLNFLLTVAGMGLITQYILAGIRRNRVAY